MKLKLKTFESLKSDGWRVRGSKYCFGLVLGGFSISRYTQNFLGTEVNVVSVNMSRNEPMVTFLINTSEQCLPWMCFENFLPKKNYVSGKKLYTKLKVKGDEVKYFSELDEFKFPCSLQEMDSETFIKVAKWGLGELGRGTTIFIDEA